MGTGGTGHTHPSAQVPNGMVQLGPNTGSGDWKRCSGYHYSDSSIVGFSHMHLSGTGIGDLGDILMLPGSGEINWNKGTEEDPDSGYRSRFSHKNEEAEPGYYRVFLDDYQVDAALTATARTGIHKYTWPEASERWILIDLEYTQGWDWTSSADLKQLSPHEISGFRMSSGWARDQRVWFHAEFSEEISSTKKFEITDTLDNGDIRKVAKMAFFFEPSSKPLVVKLGISAVDEEGARLNLKTEAPHWDFEQYRRSAQRQWEELLGALEVKTENPDKKALLYSSLYRMYLAPFIFEDVDGRYRGMDGEIHANSGRTALTVYSLWDTYRAFHPLMTILHAERVNNYVEDMIRKYEESGFLPIWELVGNETNTMIGYHAVSVISDAYVKGIRDYDADKALEAMIATAKRDQNEHWGLKDYMEYGFVPTETTRESVSKTLEYAYDDWCIAVMADSMGKTDVAREFYQRSQNWQNVYSEEFKLMRGRKKNGDFVDNFDPYYAAPWNVHTDFTEGNSWQYSWSVQHDIPGFIEKMGGVSAFETQLDSLFNQPTKMTGIQLPDITGLIGLYAHGNEPSHQISYMYNFVGKPHKTADLVRFICDEFYKNDPNGIIGNEDCGQMSAWYLFSMMGFYPVSPGSDRYEIGVPQVEELRLRLADGNILYIAAKGTEAGKNYVNGVRLNGREINRSFLYHHEIAGGGALIFEMGEAPSSWGVR